MIARSFFTQVVCVLSCFFLISEIQAQRKIWGHDATVGQALGEFRDTIIPSTTASNYSATQWTALSVKDNGTTTPGAAYWTRTTTGLSRGAYASSTAPVSSATISNGAAIFDSDFMDNGGNSGAMGTGSSAAPHRGELISPRIDLTGARDSALVLSFYSDYRFYRMTELAVYMSVDDGVSWVKVGDLVKLQGGSTNEHAHGNVSILVPSITAGVANLTQCRLKYVFEGNYYYSVIDDVSIEMAPKYNMEIGIPDEDAPTYFSTGNIIRMGGEFIESYYNIDFSNPVGWSWGAKVINKGYKDILPAAKPKLICRVDATNLTTPAGASVVYLDTIISKDTIYSNKPNGTAIQKDMVAADLNFIRQQSRGSRMRYNVSYWVEHDSTDIRTDKDTIRYTFVIDYPNGSTSGRVDGQYSSKARLSRDGGVYARTSAFPGGGPHSKFEYGSIYYFPKGASDVVKIDSINFRYRLSHAFTGAATQTVFARVYRFQDGTNGGAANGSISNEELQLVGLGRATLTGLGTPNGTPAGRFGLAKFGTVVNASTGAPMDPLVDAGFYYISVELNPSATGGAATFEARDVPIHGVDNLNYAMNFGKGTSATPFGASTMRVVDAGGTEKWYDAFKGYDHTPSIGVFFSSLDPYSTTKTLSSTLNGKLALYPNPATDILQVEIQLENTTDVQYIITDVTGRVVYYDQSKQINQEVVTVDVSTLAAGVYTVSVQTNKGVTTKQFVKK